MRIAACYIVRNEGRVLPRSLSSIQESVNDIIVVDTGSTDDTKEIAISYGAKVYEFPWGDDFSAARNFALEQVKADWVVFLDADEYFSKETAENLPKIVQIADAAAIDVLIVFLRNIDEESGAVLLETYVPRIFRSSSRLRYCGRIHEELRDNGNPVSSLRSVGAKDLVLIHTGYSHNISGAKARRNLKLLLRELKENPGADNLYMYLSEAYDGVDDDSNAMKYAELDIRLGRRNVVYASRSWRILLRRLALHAESQARRCEVARHAIRCFPELPEFYAEYAECLAFFKDFPRAIQEAREAKRVFLEYGKQRHMEPTLFTEQMLLTLEKRCIEWERMLRQDGESFLWKTEAGDEMNQSIAEKGEDLRRKIYDLLEHGDYEGARMYLSAWKMESPIEARNLLVSTYIEEGDAEGAERALTDLIALCPQSIETKFLQARVLFLRGERWESLAVLQKIPEKKIPPAWKEKIYNLMGQCWRFFGNSQRSVEYYLRASRTACSAELGALEYSNYLFNLHYLPDVTPSKARKAAQGYDDFFRHVPRFYHRWRQDDRAKLRIGYVSPDLRDHVVMRFSYALLNAYDKEKFEVFAYMSGQEDSVSNYLIGQVDGWRNINSCTADEAARLIYGDRIDILVDLSGHTQNNCLPILARKPAPVQISGIGYFASTGLSDVDYFLGDVYLDDEEMERAFTEQLLVLPQSHFCYVPAQGIPPLGEPPCQRNGYITFGSFNNFTKVNDDVLELWARILKEVPNSRLLLKASIFDCVDGRRISLQRMRKAGLELERVEVRGITREYLSEYGDVDIVLDTFPYPGGGTTCDALYMGVPVVTLRGRSHGGRFGWSILKNIGLDELAAETPEKYVERAVALAGDPVLIAMFRKNLRSMMKRSSLMDYRNYMAAVEQGYRMVWEHFLETQSTLPAREAVQLPSVMGDFVRQGDRLQALAVADMLLKARLPSKKINEQVCALYLDEGEVEHAHEALSLLSKDYLFGIFLQARLKYLQKDMDAARESCLALIAQGGLPQPWSGLEHNLLAEMYKERGDVELAAQEYRSACEQSTSEESWTTNYSNYLFSLQYLSRPPEFMLQEACRYGEYLQDVSQYTHVRRRRHKKLRIGYISPDFRRHVVACFSQAFFHGADRAQFEVYGYANCREDDVSRMLQGLADAWRNLFGYTADEAAEIIYKDEIDVLVDLSGHTGSNSLPIMARKPAPIQLCGVGYFSTTGLPCVDGFIVDQYTAVEGEEAFFVEKLLHLPHSQFCYRQVVEPPEFQPVLPMEENGWVTFGSMNNVNKISEGVLEAWGRIMREVPDARLYLKHGMLDDPRRCERELKRLETVGIDSSRIDMQGFSVSYLQEYKHMDIALDTFPYPGGGTTCDALYMGVPVITLAGRGNHERFGLSLLSNVGLPELCATSVDEYVSLAVNIARNRNYLHHLHETLRSRMEKSPVMDSAMYMRDLERIYKKLWRKYEEG